jgi:hypothetical protein
MFTYVLGGNLISEKQINKNQSLTTISQSNAISKEKLK